MQFPPRNLRSRLAILAASVLFVAPAAAATTAEDVPVSFSGAYLAARTADVEKDAESAAGFYRQALKTDPDNVFLLERSLILSASSGDLDAAMGFATKLHEKQPENHPARLLIAIGQLRAAQYPEAAKTLDEKSPGVLADLTSALLTSWAKFGEGEVDVALEGLDKLKGEDWYEPFKLLHGAYISLAAGRTADAIAKLEKARAADANAVRITEAYARALAVAGRKDEAEAALTDFLTRYPDNSLAIRALDDIRAGRGHVMTVANPVEGAAEALAGIGAAVGQEGGTEVAFLYLRLALYLDPNIAGGLAALSLGNLLEASLQREAAIESYEFDSRKRALPRPRPDAGSAGARRPGPHQRGGDRVQGGDRRQP